MESLSFFSTSIRYNLCNAARRSKKVDLDVLENKRRSRGVDEIMNDL